MLTVLRLLHDPNNLNHTLFDGAACVVSFHDDIESAVGDAYRRRDTHTSFLLRAEPVVLDRTVRGAAQWFDALVKADAETAEARALEAEERAEYARLHAKYGEHDRAVPVPGSK